MVPEDLWTRLVKLREAQAFDTSISICQQALLHCSKEIEPKWWRALKAELATALMDSSAGKPGNIERAITIYRQLEKELDRKTYPELAAWTKRGLGNAYLKRARGDSKSNLLQAINYHNDALEIYSALKNDLICASLRTGLGRAYGYLASISDLNLIDEAIRQVKEARKIFARRHATKDRADLDSFLGWLYQEKATGNVAENQDLSIRHYERALDYYLKAPLTKNRATIQEELAIGYQGRQRGKKTQNLLRAKAYLRQARRALRKGFPDDFKRVRARLKELEIELPRPRIQENRGRLPMPGSADV